MGRIRILAAMATVGGILALVTPTAQAVVLNNFNTSVTVADIGGNPGHNITGWSVDGTNQYVLGTGSWFYRVGAGPIVSLDTASFISAVQINNSGNPFDFSPTTLTTVYQDSTNGLQFSMQYQVFGGNALSGASSIQAQLTAQLVGNSTGAALSIFEVNDLAVGGTEVNDIVMPSLLEAGRKVNQNDSTTLFGEGATSKLTGPGAPLAVSDPTDREADLAGTVAAAVAAGLLSNTPAGGVGIGPDNVAYAYEYDFNMVAGTPSVSLELDVTRNLSKNTTAAVPEPVSAMLGLFGLAALGLAAGRRSTKA